MIVMEIEEIFRILHLKEPKEILKIAQYLIPEHVASHGTIRANWRLSATLNMSTQSWKIRRYLGKILISLISLKLRDYSRENTKVDTSQDLVDLFLMVVEQFLDMVKTEP